MLTNNIRRLTADFALNCKSLWHFINWKFDISRTVDSSPRSSMISVDETSYERRPTDDASTSGETSNKRHLADGSSTFGESSNKRRLTDNASTIGESSNQRHLADEASTFGESSRKPCQTKNDSVWTFDGKRIKIEKLDDWKKAIRNSNNYHLFFVWIKGVQSVKLIIRWLAFSNVFLSFENIWNIFTILSYFLD